MYSKNKAVGLAVPIVLEGTVYGEGHIGRYKYVCVDTVVATAFTHDNISMMTKTHFPIIS